MLDLIIGYWVSKLVYVAARLDLADRLSKGPRSAAQLAKDAGVDPLALHRAMRALAGVGVFAEDKLGRFRLTPLGQTLRSDRPDSMRDFALMMPESYNWRAWDQLFEGIRTGETPFSGVHGMPAFDYLDRHPEDREIFARSMASLSATENPAVAAGYDFARLGTLVDVGGSQGHLLAAVLGRHAKLRGTLFDMPAVVEQARQAPYLTAPKLSGRIEFAAGDFFKAVPDSADAYMMKYILHDWNDDQCVTILGNCRDAMAPTGRVLIVDTVIAAGNRPQWGKLLDINMLALTGGRERTRAEFAELLERSGLRLKRVYSTACPLSIVVAVRA